MKKYLIFDMDGTLIDSKELVDKIILEEIGKEGKEFEKKAEKIINETAGSSIIEFLEEIFSGTKVHVGKVAEIIMDRIIKKENEINLFKGVKNEIKKLHKDYKLFLTTGNYTKIAKDILKHTGIKKYFEIVKGSSTIPKGQEHLELFKQYSKDKDFYKYSVYIGDGNKDREFALFDGIDFIHIGDLGKDKYEIESVRFLKKELNEIDGTKKPEKIGEEIVFKSPFKNIIRKDYKVKDGTIKNMYVDTIPGNKKTGTMVLPLNEKGEIIYTKEFRYGVEDYVIGFPIGILEENLSEEENIKKELKEETGYETNDFEYLGETIESKYNDIIIKYYLAKNCKKGEQKLESSEYIEVFTTTKKKFKKMIKDGKVKCPLTISCFSLGKSKI